MNQIAVHNIKNSPQKKQKWCLQFISRETTTDIGNVIIPWVRASFSITKFLVITDKEKPAYYTKKNQQRQTTFAAATAKPLPAA